MAAKIVFIATAIIICGGFVTLGILGAMAMKFKQDGETTREYIKHSMERGDEDERKRPRR